MGEMADFALDDIMDEEDARADYHRGEMAEEDAYERGIINEFGGEERGKKEKKVFRDERT